MPGLIWSSKGEVLSGGAGVPDGSADGQFLLWNAAAGDWQAQSITPGDIGAAAAVHTHDWAGITRVEHGYQNVAVGNHIALCTLGYNESALILLTEFKSSSSPTPTRAESMFRQNRRPGGGVLVSLVHGSTFGTVSGFAGQSAIYSNTYSQTLMLNWLALKFGEGA
jgi:hypothetical protein